MKIIYVILFSTAISLLMSMFLMWSSARDEQIAQGAEIYEKCIQEQYATSPQEYYYQHNVYPICQK